MSKNENKLYELIHSLDASEKRNFKKFSKLHSSKEDLIYLKMYAEIEKMKAYDENKLIKKFGKKNLSYNKTYLYNQIMSSLRLLFQDKGHYIKTLNEIISINILQRKGLFEQADNILEKTIPKSEASNSYFLTLQMIDTKFQMLKIRNKDINYLKVTNQLKDSFENNFVCINKKLKLSYYVSSFIYLLEKGFNLKKMEHLSIINSFLEDPDFKEKDDSLITAFENDRLILHSISYDRLKDYKNALKYGILQHENFLRDSIGKETSIEDDTHSLVNVILSSILANEEEKLNGFLNDLLQLKVKHENEDPKKLKTVDLNCLVHKFYHFARNKSYDECINEFEKLWETFLNIEKDIEDYFVYPTAYLYAYLFKFNGNRFEEALDLMNKCFLVSKDKNRALINKYEDLFKAICLYEQGDSDVAMDLINSYKRKTKIEKGSFTDHILKVIKAKIDRKDISKLKEIFIELKSEKLDVYEKSLFRWYLG